MRFRSSFFSLSFILLIIGCETLPLHSQPTSTQETLRQAVEVSARDGLPNVIQKLESGLSVKVAYLGGSITAAKGWRVQSLEWLQHQYPTAKLEEVDAAIGGTGSDLGVFRVQQDALSHRPDLLFVEFAVNDGGAPPLQIQKCMEGIVRQTWKSYPNTDICFVYTLSLPFLKDLQNGKFSRSASNMEVVADHYKIPSIHLGLEVAELEKNKKLVFQQRDAKSGSLEESPIIFSADGVHPFVETGHALYLKAIQRSWPKIKGKSPSAHTLPAPLHADNWEDAKIVDITPDMLSGDWTLLDPNIDDRARSFKKRLPKLWRANQSGAKLKFTVSGRAAFVYDLVGPDGGHLSIKLDQDDPRTVARIDGYCTYHRLSKLPLFQADQRETHEVEIVLTAEKPDKGKILFESNRPDLEKNPAKYGGLLWHAGSLLILGEVNP